FVYLDRTAFDVLAVELLDGGFRGLIRSHLHKTETARAVRRAIDDYLGAVNFTCFGERILQVLIGDSPGQVANVQSATHYILPGAPHILDPHVRGQHVPVIANSELCRRSVSGGARRRTARTFRKLPSLYHPGRDKYSHKGRIRGRT